MMCANSTMGNRFKLVMILVACVGASWHVAFVAQCSRIAKIVVVLKNKRNAVVTAEEGISAIIDTF